MGAEPVIDFSKLIYPEQITGDDEEDSALLQTMHSEAADWLSQFAWCSRIRQSFFGCGIGGVCAVFLFEIAPAYNGVDCWLWVITGDIPPAYLVIDEAPDPRRALTAYIELMRAWVAAAEACQSTEELIPVSVAPTPENAARLRRRLDCIEELDLPSYRANGPVHT